MRKLSTLCPECLELALKNKIEILQHDCWLRKYKTEIRQSDGSRIDYFVCNGSHKLRYVNGAYDRKVDALRGAKITESRKRNTHLESPRFPLIPGARNIMGRCWSGSE
jgi:hypothetical protein